MEKRRKRIEKGKEEKEREARKRLQNKFLVTALAKRDSRNNQGPC